MIKTAQLTEMAIIYGNKFRSSMKEIDVGLSNAEMLFHKGEYQEALEVSMSTIELMDKNIREKLLKYYNREI